MATLVGSFAAQPSTIADPSSIEATNGYRPGTMVELHSLSNDALNGRIGECGAFNSTTARQAVALVRILKEPIKKVAVKLKNIKRPFITKEALTAADKETSAANGKLVQCRNGQVTDPNQLQSIFQEACELLVDIIQRVPTCAAAHQTLGDALHMTGDFAKALPHYRRAAENGGSLHSRLSYSGMLGETGDEEGEIYQLETILREEPQFTPTTVQVRLNYGNILRQVGKIKKAYFAYAAVFGSAQGRAFFCAYHGQVRSQYIKGSSTAAADFVRAIRMGIHVGTFVKTNKLHLVIATDGNGQSDITSVFNFFTHLLDCITPDLPDCAMLKSVTKGSMAACLRDLGRFDEAISEARAALQIKSGNENPLDQNTSFFLNTIANCYEAQGDALQESGDFPKAKSVYSDAMSFYIKALQAKADPAAEVGLVRVQCKMDPDTWEYGRANNGSGMIFIRCKKKVDVRCSGRGNSEENRGHPLLLWNTTTMSISTVAPHPNGSIGRFPSAPAA